jgi:glycosyltransferase involved in cell wall biosynthesis
MAFEYAVVIPAFNAEKHISETLVSVLSQTCPPTKIIVVDDGSTDATAAVSADISPLVEVIRTPNNGAGAATTIGLSHVQTPYVATVDSDDLWLHEKVAIQSSVFIERADVDAVVCRITPFGDILQKTADEADSGWSRTSLLIKTDVFRRVGPVVDMTHGYGEMVDWFRRARVAGVRFHMIERPLAKRRIHSASMSFRADENRTRDMLELAMRAIQDRRACGD